MTHITKLILFPINLSILENINALIFLQYFLYFVLLCLVFIQVYFYSLFNAEFVHFLYLILLIPHTFLILLNLFHQRFVTWAVFSNIELHNFDKYSFFSSKYTIENLILFSASLNCLSLHSPISYPLVITFHYGIHYQLTNRLLLFKSHETNFGADSHNLVLQKDPLIDVMFIFLYNLMLPRFLNRMNFVFLQEFLYGFLIQCLEIAFSGVFVAVDGFHSVDEELENVSHFLLVSDN